MDSRLCNIAWIDHEPHYPPCHYSARLGPICRRVLLSCHLHISSVSLDTVANSNRTHNPITLYGVRWFERLEAFGKNNVMRDTKVSISRV